MLRASTSRLLLSALIASMPACSTHPSSHGDGKHADDGADGADAGDGGDDHADEPASDAESLFVSPSGDDANPGTKDAPLRTLAAARDAVRSRLAGMTKDLTVYLRDGTYTIDAPVAFGAADSAPDGFTVHYAAYQDEKPVLSGGAPVTGWQASASNPKIFTAHVDGRSFRQLYFGPTKGKRADSLAGATKRPPLQRKAGATFIVSKSDAHIADLLAQSETQLSSTEIVIAGSWNFFKLRIAKIVDLGNGSVDIYPQGEDLSLFHCGNKPNPGAAYTTYVTAWDQACGNVERKGMMEGWVDYYSYTYYLENNAAFLASPGDWSLDEATGTVSVYAPDGVTSSADLEKLPVIAPQGSKDGDDETLIALKGEGDQLVKNIEFTGLTFAHTNWLSPSHHGVGIYNPSYETRIFNKPDGTPSLENRPTPAAFTIEGADNITLRRNAFVGLGSDAVKATAGAVGRSLVLQGNAFVDVAGSGVQVSSYAFDVSSNVFRRIGLEYAGAGVIGIAPYGGSFTHNDLDTIGSGAIVMFGYNDPASLGNLIAENRIAHAVTQYVDFGAIYVHTFVTPFEAEHAATVLLVGNRIDAVDRPSWYDDAGWYINASIYLDGNGKELSVRGATVSDNTVTTTNGQPILLNCPGEDTVKNNKITAAIPVPGRSALQISWLDATMPAGWTAPIESGNGASTVVDAKYQPGLKQADADYWHAALGL